MVDITVKKCVNIADDPDITDDCINTQVTLPENGVSTCVISANNDKGKNYLAHYKLYDVVTVKYAYDEDDPEWTTIVPTFTGYIIDLQPSMSRTGEIVSVTAINIGSSLKQTRVAQEYGRDSSIVKSLAIDALYTVNDYTLESNEDFTKVGESPYLFINEGQKDTDKIYAPCYKGTGSLVEMGYSILGTGGAVGIDDAIQGDIVTSNENGGLGQSITVGLECLISAWTGKVKCAIYLHSDLSLKGVTEERTITLTNVGVPQWEVFHFTGSKPVINPSTAYIIVVWAEDGTGGDILVVWDAGSVNERHQQILEYNGFPNPLIPNHYDDKLSIYCSYSESEPFYADEYSWTFPHLSTDYEYFSASDIHLTLRGQLYAGSGGHCTQMGVEAQLWIDDEWVSLGEVLFYDTGFVELDYGNIAALISSVSQFNSLKLRLMVSQISDGGIDKGGIELSYATLYVKGIIWDDSLLSTLREILTDSEEGIIPKYLRLLQWTESGTPISSGYDLGTDYIYDDPSIYPFLDFPYQDTFMCLQDLIRLGSSLHYMTDPDDWRGLHWIIYTGLDSVSELLIAPVGDHDVEGVTGHNIKTLWPTRVASEPLIVKEDMITQAFKTEIPLANYVLVAGKFIFPKNDNWTELSAEDWNVGYFIDGVWTLEDHPENFVLNDLVNYKVGLASIQHYHPVGGIDYYYFYPKDTDLDLDLNVFTARTVVPKLCFWYYKGANVEGNKVVLFAPDEKNTFEIDVPSIDGAWAPIEIDLTDNGKDVWTKGGSEGNPSWATITKVGFKHHTTMFGAADVRIDGLEFVGNTIRGAYTSDCSETDIENCTIGCIKHYGCRFLTIKDSLASTDTLNPQDDSSPLAQLALYELLRNRIIRTSGQITIPLDPTIMPGQLVHIHACWDEVNTVYRIDRDFRITEVQHNFVIKATTTALTLTDDLLNSIPIDTTDPYTIVMRAINPDYQSRTYASLKTGGDFNSRQKPISKDYTS
jgi:hypothetical protein